MHHTSIWGIFNHKCIMYWKEIYEYVYRWKLQWGHREAKWAVILRWILWVNPLCVDVIILVVKWLFERLCGVCWVVTLDVVYNVLMCYSFVILKLLRTWWINDILRNMMNYVFELLTMIWMRIISMHLNSFD